MTRKFYVKSDGIYEIQGALSVVTREFWLITGDIVLGMIKDMYSTVNQSNLCMMPNQ